MGRGKSRKQAKQPRTAESRARTTREAACDPATGAGPTAGNGQSNRQQEGREQRKIKRSRPLLVASCVLLIVWFAILAALAWHSANSTTF